MPPKSPNDPQNLKVLRNSVIIMGILLVVGTIALFIAVIIKASNTQKEPQIVYNTAPAEKPAKCQYKATGIPIQSTVLSATTNNNILTIVTEKAVLPKNINSIVNGNSLELSADKDKIAQQVILYDLCAGEVVSRIDLIESK